jgi:hypothetical protein
VRTQKVTDDRGEALVFQFLESDEMEAVRMSLADDPAGTQAALAQLYEDAFGIYERARNEVTIERKDGRRQKYAAVRYKQQIENGRGEGLLVPAIANIVKRRTIGFDHLEAAGRRDLMVETLVLDTSKPYHQFFSPKTIEVARERMAEYDARH